MGGVWTENCNATITNNVFDSNHDAVIMVGNRAVTSTVQCSSNNFHNNDYTLIVGCRSLTPEIPPTCSNGNITLYFFNNYVCDNAYIDPQTYFQGVSANSVLFFNTTMQAGTRIYTTGTTEAVTTGVTAMAQ